MFKQFAALMVRQRSWVLFIILGVTIALGWHIRNLKIVINPATMLPQSHPSVVGTNLAERLFGSKHVVVIGVSAANGGDIYKPEVMAAVEQLSDRIATVPGVKRHTLMSLTADKAKAISGKDDEFIVEKMYSKPFTADSMTALKRKLQTNPIYKGTLVSEDETVASVSFAIDAGAAGFRSIMDGIDKVVEAERNSSVKLRISGAPVFLASVERFAQRLAFLFPIALLLIGLIHYEAFRTMQGLVLPLVTALLAVVWGLGIMGAANVMMDAFNATTPILILAVAAGHAVQILKRYYEEYQRLALENGAESPKRLNDAAIIESLAKVGPVMLISALVAALGFFSLITFEIATIRTFGIFTGLGILSALIIELTFIPALRSYLSAPKIAIVAKGDSTVPIRIWDKLVDKVTNLIVTRRFHVMAVFLLIIIAAGFSLPHLNHENSTKSYFGEKLLVRQDDSFLNQKLAGTNTLYVVFQGKQKDSMKDPAVLKLIEDTQRHLETLPSVGKTLSIVDFLKQMNLAIKGNDLASKGNDLTTKGNDLAVKSNEALDVGTAGRGRVLPDSQDLISQYLMLYSMSGEPTDFDAYIDYDYQNAALVIWAKSDSSKFSESILKAVHAYVDPKLPPDVSIQIGGGVAQSSALSEVLVEGKIKNIAQMILVVFVVGSLIFRSLIAGIYLIVPLLVTVMVNFGVMALFGIPLNTPNSVSSAMAIGIGADYAIYLLYRIREELKKGSDVTLALKESLRTAGKAVMYVASAIAGGYSVLMFSFDFYVHIWFGILIVLSMIVSAISALILIPCLLAASKPGFLLVTRDQARPKTAVYTTFFAFCVVAAALFSLFIPDTSYAQESKVQESKVQDSKARDIVEKSYQVTRFENSISEATFRLQSSNGQERVRKTFGASKFQSNGVDNRRFIRFKEPSDVRNTSTLITEHTEQSNEIWVYLPALKKVRRLASNNTRSSFVGTDLSYGDLVGYRTDDWIHKLLREEQFNNTGCYVVESLPRTQEVAADSGYSKRTLWISKDNFVVLKTDFYDSNSNLLKVAESSDFKLIDSKLKKWQALTLQVKNMQTGHTTHIHFDKFEANVNVSDEIFSTRYMEKEQ